METAINIGYACRVLTEDQRQCIISSEVPEITAAEDKPLDVQDRVLRNQVQILSIIVDGGQASQSAEVCLRLNL